MAVTFCAPVNELGEGVGLIVVATVGEGEEFVQEVLWLRRFFWQENVAALNDGGGGF
ncbi:MAG: hypothetical protein AAGC95_17765 [Pseudomonadota bacterium]